MKELEFRNKEYESEKGKTDKMYKYINMLEEPVAKNLEIVKCCINLENKIQEYENLKKDLEDNNKESKSQQ